MFRTFITVTGIMALAIVVRLIGWLLHVKDLLFGDGPDRMSTWDAILTGVPRGWEFAEPFVHWVLIFLGVVLFVSIVVLLFPLISAIAFRSAPIGIFLSYSRSRMQLAGELANVLRKHGFVVHFLPFDERLGHDDVISRIRDAQAASKFVICLPGDGPSYVDSEVAAASATNKGIIFVLEYPTGRIPNTAAKAYPVLRLDRLLMRDFKPLVDLMKYLRGDWRSVIQIYLLPGQKVEWIELAVAPFYGIAVACLLFTFFLAWCGGLALYATEFFFPESFKIAAMVVLMGLLLCSCSMMLVLGLTGLVTNGLGGVVKRAQAATTARNLIKTGSYSDDVLRNAFAAADASQSNPLNAAAVHAASGILDALCPERPLAHHE